MLTYIFEKSEQPLYEQVYNSIKNDILSGRLCANEKLPSKRTFAANNGISTITIQNAYDQLISEGYIFTIPKKGYYVADILDLMKVKNSKSQANAPHSETKKKSLVNDTNKIDSGNLLKKENLLGKEFYESGSAEKAKIDLSSNQMNSDNFPFTIWAKLSREVISQKKSDLMKKSPTCGIFELREAIATHLKSFRGMNVDPEQIVIGAGTEYLYGLLIFLLGTQKKYCIENPGYKKLEKIYKQYKIDCKFADLDEKGVSVGELLATKTDVAHISPNHHFPTGITMPISRRYEILGWAAESDERYIIEDDYDSEFRTTGRPIPTLFSVDALEKVIYMNTFSKTLSPTIRLSYMVLPPHLVERFNNELLFYSCTVSNFEQFTMAEFIKRGFFEKHINRMRLYYGRLRKNVIESFNKSELSKKNCEILETDSGLHFLLKIDTELSETEFESRLISHGINLQKLSDFYMNDEKNEKVQNEKCLNEKCLNEKCLNEKKLPAQKIKNHHYIVNYSNVDLEKITIAFNLINECL